MNSYPERLAVSLRENSWENRFSPGRNESGHGPDAGRTIEFKGMDADRTRAAPFLPVVLKQVAIPHSHRNPSYVLSLFRDATRRVLSSNAPHCIPLVPLNVITIPTRLAHPALTPEGHVSSMRRTGTITRNVRRPVNREGQAGVQVGLKYVGWPFT
eukprot:gene17950-biopygen11426